MPSIWSAFSSSSTSSSPAKGKSKSKSSDDIFRNSGGEDRKKKLTRQRKLRHVSDDEVGLRSSEIRDTSQSLPVSPETGSGHRTPHAGGSHWSDSAVPQPLPLPEVKNSSATRNPPNISPTYRRRGFPLELNINTEQNDFNLHFPVKSAPTSGYSSPVLSPQRYLTVDIFRHSSQETSAFDRISKSCQISPLPTPAPDHNTAARPEGNIVNVHPLPRPPKSQWQKGRPIGRGTYGSVYIATHCETGATCAVKEVEMIADDPQNEECIRQLEQEIKFLKELKHPNIVQYYGCEIIEDRFCIYLEYIHPGPINKYVREHCGVMTESIVRNFTRHILLGLAYLHNTKTIHRDIKGANLLVNSAGVVKLADFGLAKHLTGQNIDLSLKGTPHWMAPEVLQAMMRKDAIPELACGVDIWSVGCTVIEMLTGKPPWSQLNGVQAMFNILNKTPPIPETLSAEGKDFLHWCFIRKPADRPTAVKLLDHPFLRSSHDQNVGQEIAGMKLPDIPSPSEWIRRSKDVMPLSSGTRNQHGKLPVNGETSRRYVPESPDFGVPSHQSHFSTLEILHCVSSPNLNRGTKIISPSNVPNNLLVRSGNNSPSVISWKGNRAFVVPKIPERKEQSCNVQPEIRI